MVSVRSVSTSRPAALLAAAAFSTPAPAGDLPDPALTPGAVLATDSAAVCTPGYARSVRHVSGKVKAAVYREYGIAHHASGEYEVDHLISLELGGSNDIRNFWPQSYRTEPWNAHVKDKLEDTLHMLVCAGKLSLPDAQKAIAGDWISAYKRWVPN
jgi:hypothetical protein